MIRMNSFFVAKKDLKFDHHNPLNTQSDIPLSIDSSYNESETTPVIFNR